MSRLSSTNSYWTSTMFQAMGLHKRIRHTGDSGVLVVPGDRNTWTCVSVTRYASSLSAQTLVQHLSLNVSIGTYELCDLGRVPVPNYRLLTNLCLFLNLCREVMKVPISLVHFGDSVSWHRKSTEDQAQCNHSLNVSSCYY